LARKPERAGQGKNGKYEQKEKGNYEGGAADIRVSNYFTEPQQVVIRKHYGQQYRAARKSQICAHCQRYFADRIGYPHDGGCSAKPG